MLLFLTGLSVSLSTALIVEMNLHICARKPELVSGEVDGSIQSRVDVVQE